MGGSIALLTALQSQVTIEHCVMDGGITPYRLPWIITRLIALKDYLMMMFGRIGGVGLLEKAFSTDELTDEDVQYAAKVLRMISAKTIWRTFESCNNYHMPKEISSNCRHIEYWVAEKEMKDRTADVAYIKRVFPHTIFRKVKNMGHGGLAPFNPELFVRGIERMKL